MKQSKCVPQTLELSAKLIVNLSSQKVKPKADKQKIIYAVLSKLSSNSEH